MSKSTNMNAMGLGGSARELSGWAVALLVVAAIVTVAVHVLYP